MASDFIAIVIISAATLTGGLCYLLYNHYRRKRAMRELVQGFMQDYFLMEQDYMEAHRAMIHKACQENAKENLRNKD